MCSESSLIEETAILKDIEIISRRRSFGNFSALRASLSVMFSQRERDKLVYSMCTYRLTGRAGWQK